MKLKERLVLLMSKEKLNANQFCKKADLGNGFVDKIGDSLRRPSIEKIKKAFPNWNMHWLITGEGEMLTNESKIQPEESLSNNNLNENVMNRKIRDLEDNNRLLLEKIRNLESENELLKEQLEANTKKRNA